MDSAVRTEVLHQVLLARFESEIQSALRRRSPSEARLAGALRTLALASPAIRAQQAELATTLLRRGAHDRSLYGGAIRSLAESGHPRAASLIETALATESGGGLATISAACFCKDASLAAPLLRLAVARNTHLAFAGEVARTARGESNGARLLELAPKLKESHRIAVCSQMFLPMARQPVRASPAMAAALGVLRSSERHLGRWLVLAEVARRAGDSSALQDAKQRSLSGPRSSRAAWSLVAWALDGQTPPPPIRPTADLMARLSDRPSADRDTTFLFRMALARVPSTRAMLEALARTFPFPDEVAVRAAMHLVLDHGRADLMPNLVDTAADEKRPELRGVAAAALWDLGDRARATQLADALISTRALSSVAWGALVSIARQGSFLHAPLLSEPAFRRMQYGWVE